MKKKKIDPKDIVIGALAVFVLLEAYLLLSQTPKEIVVVKKIAQPAVAAPQQKPQAISLKPIVPKPIVGRVAIIIDDCGYNLLPCEFSEKIKAPVTFSVLPGLQHSTDAAECAHQQNKEVMLHLPMEPHHNDDKYPQDYILTTAMPKSKVVKIIDEALKTVPHAQGVNNHMGSKATENKPLMTTVFSTLKKKGFFFVDSLVTEKSICQNLAASFELPFSERTIFLDNQNERDYIEGQFAQLAQIARKKGFAIAIGHARRLTLEVIKEQTEALSQEGIEFVTVHNIISKENEYLGH